MKVVFFLALLGIFVLYLLVFAWLSQGGKEPLTFVEASLAALKGLAIGAAIVLLVRTVLSRIARRQSSRQ